MLITHLKIATRNLVRNKVFSGINILGLAMGMAAFLLIMFYVSFEYSYDSFHKNSQSLFRIQVDNYKNGGLENSNVLTYYGVGPAIKEYFPEVEDFARLHRANGMYSAQDKAGNFTGFHEKNAFYVDSSFFKLFTFTLLKGTPGTVLRNPVSILLSESAARKYFGATNPIGQTMQLSTEWEGGNYVVEGIFKDVPENSHLQFDFLLPIANLLKNKQFQNRGWYWTNFYNYLLLKPGTDPASLEKKLPLVIEKYLGKQMAKNNSLEKLRLQPVPDIHLYSNVMGEAGPNGDYKAMYFLLLMAGLLIFISWLNYINLAVTRSIERAKEVGIRKIIGSGKTEIIKQFLLESFLLNAIAVGLAVCLFFVALPYFAELTGKQFSVPRAYHLNFWLLFIGILGFGSLVAGFYPAYILSSFRPINSLKGQLTGTFKGGQLRKGLVVFQFAVSIIFILGTSIIYQQIRFMRQQDLGFELTQKVVIKGPRETTAASFQIQLKYLKDRLGKYPAVQQVSSSSEVPGKEIFWNNYFRKKQEPESADKLFHILAVDHDFLPLYKIKLIAGKNFSKDKTSDIGTVIINQAAVEAFGFEDPASAIGQEIITNNFIPMKVIGVTDDFHQQSLKNKVKPTVLYFIPWTHDYITLSINSKEVKATVDLVAQEFKKVFPGNAFEYFFLDTFFNDQYQADTRLGQVFLLLAGLTIFISSLGLFAMVLYAAAKRTKEIGIRKVLGATVFNIAFLLSKEFLILILIANLIAGPLAWLLVHKWLESFAYRTNLSFWNFLAAGAGVISIAAIPLGFQAIKAAMANPVKSLRSE